VQSEDQSKQKMSPGLPLIDKECADFLEFQKWWRGADGYLHPGWERRYTAGANLKHLQGGSNPDSPYWIVKADSSIMKGHNDLDNDTFTDLMGQVYDDLVRSGVEQPCRN
jgi:hypothetical protein